jgi:hypothetical protein
MLLLYKKETLEGIAYVRSIDIRKVLKKRK